MNPPVNLVKSLDQLPLMAILRHLPAAEAEEVGKLLVDAGFRCIEVPFSSPETLRCIEILSAACGREALIGAGTVLNKTQAEQAAEAGARFVVMPHTDTKLIKASVQLGLETVPGFATVSEAMQAISAGACALKLFPAEALPPKALGAMKAVLPKQTPILPVGSIDPMNMAAYHQFGAGGFGVGGSLYKPHYSRDEIQKRAEELARAARALDTRR